MYLLDTNIVSELRRNKPHGAVVAWIQGIPDNELFLSAVTIGEIQAGIELTREQNNDKAKQLEQWLNQVSNSYNILPMDAAIFQCWAKLMHKESNTVYEDAMIAATAIQHNLVVATRNTKDFERFEVAQVNPFESA